MNANSQPDPPSAPAAAEPTTPAPGCVPLPPIQQEAIRLAGWWAVREARREIMERAARGEPLPSLESDIGPLVLRVMARLRNVLAQIPVESGLFAGVVAAHGVLEESLSGDLHGARTFLSMPPPPATAARADGREGP
jgi:hypothetical protein